MIKVLALASFLLLAGCDTLPHIELVQRAPLAISNPAPVILEDMHVYAITRDNAQQQLNAIEQTGNPPVGFALSENDYAILQKNLGKLQGKLDEYKNILLEYKKYYETPTKKKDGEE